MADRDDERYGRGTYDRERSGADRSGRDDDRGFIERASDQVRNMFRDDDDRGERTRASSDRGGSERGGERDRPYQGGYGGGAGEGGRDRGMSYGARGYSTQNNDEYRRDEGGPRPMTGDYGRGGGRDFGHDEDRAYGAGGYGDRSYGGMDAGTSGQGRYGQSQGAQGWYGQDNGSRSQGGQGGQYGQGQPRQGGQYGARPPSGQGAGMHDPHYQEWRERQVAQLDRDYDEYRREHQQRFETEFHGWRTSRQGQRDALRQVKEHQEVVGDDGEHVGTVDKVRGDQIILTKKDEAAGGRHHAIPSSWVQGVGEKVMLNRSGDKARAAWAVGAREAEREHAERGQGQSAMGQGGAAPANRPLGHENDRDADGPHILDRSFSGTYDRKGGDR